MTALAGNGATLPEILACGNSKREEGAVVNSPQACLVAGRKDIGAEVASSTATTEKLFVFLLFFFSGASGLIYQVAWVRMFTHIFGSTTIAVSTVLAAFMAGLALGSYVFGVVADRYKRQSLLFYGILEGAIGAYAFALPHLLSSVESLHVAIYRNYEPGSWLFILIRFVICLVILLLPTTMMGATLPLLAKFLVRQFKTVGRGLGILYATNTAGAVIGCYLAGFHLIASLGVTRTMHVAVLVNLVIMGAACLAHFLYVRVANEDTMGGEAAPVAERPLENYDSGKSRIIVFCFALAGFASLCYEVLWTRALVFFMGFSTYAFSAMLTTFLLGLALGSFLFSRIADKSNDRYFLFFKIEAVIGLWGILSIPLFTWAFYKLQERWEYYVNIDLSWEYTFHYKFLKAFLVMILPTTLMGAAFPVVCRIFTSDLKKLGRDVAAVYSANTVGAIVGSAAAGLVIIPLLGTQKGIVLIGAVNILIAMVALFMSTIPARRKALALAATGGAAAIVLIFSSRDVVLRAPWEQWESLLFYEEDSMALVKVFRTEDGRTVLSIDGDTLAGTGEIMQTNQKMLAHLPMLLHDDPRTVLIVGFGAGGTSYSMSLYQPDRIDCVEFVPSVLKAAPFFDEVNHGVLSSPIYNVTLDDGRTFLLTSEDTYDVLSVDTIDPKHYGSSNLYSRDFYELCRQRLNPDGIMVQWLPFSWLTCRELSAVFASFASVFEYPTLWFNRHFTYFLMVGSNHELEIDYQRLSERMSDAQIADDLRVIHLTDPAQFLYCFAADTDAFRQLASEAPKLNTYDMPVLEFFKYNAGETVRCQPLIERKGMPKLTNLGKTPEEEALVRKKIEDHLNIANYIILTLHCDEAKEAVQRWRYNQAALKLNPSDVVARWLLPYSEVLLRKQQERIVASIREKPSPDRFSLLADFYYQLGEFAPAIAVMEEGLQSFPDSSEMRLQLADYYETIGNSKAASLHRKAALTN
ncbi:MAG: MFS transporter [Candidatus Abyssobacteria bacterium SURF_5]|uniref:Polyamine aminopropyltransferase n=1 Tax=Abyssobacteria bacterium (strain SURF_5) TaxID=2093360 RepID=A0A3A4NQH5_ABYX5|nr:MAG: MFS transporter [Candidatus Abyssubacteria bacterium SURF_5]